jgi:hypothetical protein
MPMIRPGQNQDQPAVFDVAMKKGIAAGCGLGYGMRGLTPGEAAGACR